jgi:putative membrane protein
MNRTSSRRWLRAGALVLGIMTAFTSVAYAAEPQGGELPVRWDEAYYATLDYYGGLTQGSVVKSYHLQGNSSITDYGRYDAVNNLTDGTEPSVNDQGAVTFDFGENAPETFYFEGETAAPYQDLPWDISLSYRFNGVPVRAEEMAGQKGMAEITLDLLPNPSASDYAKQNFVLVAATAFNDNDILSLSAPGSQTQLLGNLRTVMYIVLPGEEQHFTLQVGSEDFSFPGLVLLMMPATLDQLEQVADLRQAKEEIQDSYDALNQSMDILLDSLDGMGSDLQAAASGLDELNKARGIVSENREELYERFYKVLDDMWDLDGSMDDIREHLGEADTAAGKVSGTFTELYGSIGSLRQDLQDCLKILSGISGELEEGGDISSSLEQLAASLEALRQDTQSLQNLADEAASGNLEIQPEFQEQLNTAKALHSSYAESGGDPADMNGFYTFAAAALASQGYPPKDAAQAATQLVALYQAEGAIDDINGESQKLQELAGLTGTSQDLTSALQVAGDVSDLCGQLEALLAQLQGGSGDPGAGAGAIASVDAILGELQDLLALAGGYQDEVHETLRDTKKTTARAQDLIHHLRSFLFKAEDVLEDCDPHLDKGTDLTLSGLAQALRRAASGLGQVGTVRNAKDTVTDLIEEKWDQHTGEIDNLLLVDPSAPKESLTDQRNGSPESIQVVMRTQEIKAEEEEAPTAQDAEAPSATFFDRVAAMFRDFWDFLTSPFQKKD